MQEVLTVLGLASRAGGERLHARMVAVALSSDDDLEVRSVEPWEGTRGTDDARQLVDLHDAIVNVLDPKRQGAPQAVAVKRVESPSRGRPSAAYDRRIRF